MGNLYSKFEIFLLLVTTKLLNTNFRS